MSGRGPDSAPTRRIPGGPDRRQRTPGFGAGAVLAGVVLAAGAGGVLFADRLGIDDRTPFVQLMAFRPQLSTGLLVLALGVGGLGRRTRAVLPAALALGLVGALGVAVVAPRGTGSPADPADGGAEGRTLTVLTLNTYFGRADADAVADIVRERRPDLIALPEAGGELRRELTALLDDDAGGVGYRSSVADDSDDASPMTVFVARGLGRPAVTDDRRGTFPAIVVDLPGTAGGLRFVAVHPQSPKPGDTKAWGRDVADLARWCSASRPTVVAGDMNSTADHREFREATARCTDAAASVGEGLTGTWPSGLPRVLGAQIDHVLLSGGPRALAVEVLDVDGTDHRAVLATLAVD